MLSVFKKTKSNSQRTESILKETAVFERIVEDASAPYIRITISKQDKLFSWCWFLSQHLLSPDTKKSSEL